MEKTYNIVELFSGIGSQAAALKNLGVKINTVGTSEWDVHAIVAYDMIHGGTFRQILRGCPRMNSLKK